jgi:putative SOS response-associated peptidase YedK
MLVPMCGRIIRTSPRATIEETFNATADPSLDFRPRYNLCPSQPLIAVVADDGARWLRAFRWGLVPHFAQQDARAPQPINARAETVATKPLFRGALRHRRCLVVADGFYEWKAEPSGKVPHVIRLRACTPFAIAGLWENAPPSDGPPRSPTALVLTCAPNTLMAPIHNRMPVLFAADAAARWLDPRTEVGELQALLAPYPAEGMEAYPVSRLVNNPRVDIAECAAAL